ncbi:MAG: D-alanyl-D-alanine carboxypeptidase/D-alanyl-D-alanine-endopeptidase, partial [Syntrophorhabdus sp.]
TARQNMVSLGYVGPTSLKLSGSIRPDCPKKIYYVAVRYPAQFGGHVFRETLSSGGIILKGTIACARNCPNTIDISTKRSGSWQTLALYRSPRLAEIMKVVNKLSNNLYAEMLLVAMGNTLNQGTNGPRATDAALAALARAGVDTAGIVMADGSGLSRYNLITTRQLADILRVMAKGPYADHFYESLPIMSIDGTLGRRLKDSAATGKVRAKTGTITGVRSLSGYLTTKTGENLVFSIISNGHESVAAVDRAIDKIMLRLLDYSADKD